MHDFTVNKDKCNKCGLCAKECVAHCIEMSDYPTMENENCLKCMHCLAVCTNGGISFGGHNPEESTLLKGNLSSAESMKTLIKGRRSVRHYKDENIDQAQIQELIETVSHAPTGANARSVMMTVIDDKEILAQFKEEVYAFLTDYLDGKVPDENDHLMIFLHMFVEAYNEKGIDLLFKDAPHLILTSTPPGTPCGTADSHIQLAYFELMAQSMGLGTVWNGMVNEVLTIAPQFALKLGIPADHQIGYAMSFGKPSIKYQRTVERDPGNLNYVKEISA